ncbi:MAG: UvrD-helicase domain-containing protein [Janthinobacterium lividum]
MELIAFPSPRLSAPPDAEQRALALDTQASWIVEAPAGSGKTGLLIQRYLKLLASVDDPAEVLALTFTRKATGEMRERVLQALRAAATDLPCDDADFERMTRTFATAVLQRDGERAWRILERPYRLNIRTIDSLCSEILRAVPLLSGGIGSATPVADAEPMYRRAAHAVLMRFGGADPALNRAIETVLLHRDGDLMFCESVLAEMLATREQWGRLIPLSAAELDDAALDSVVLPRLNQSLERTLCAALTGLHRCFPEAELEQVARIARQLADAEGPDGSPSAFAQCAVSPWAPGTEAQHLNHWLLVAQLLLTKTGGWRKTFTAKLVGAQVPKNLVVELKELITGIDSEELAALLHAVRGLPPGVYPERQWVVTKALFRLLQHALVELQLLFAREEVCDFSAVALAARAALQADAGEVQVTFGTRLQHLLVDEMQDTSSSQYELLECLTSGWDGASQTVFLVGDPKQSIYLFRQARVELFQRCMQEGAIGDIPLGVLQLSANFRSGQRIVQEFNETFTEVFPADRIADGDVTYSPAESIRPEKPGEGIAWHMRLLERPEDPGTGLRKRQLAMRREAATIADIIAQQRQGQPASRIAVLTRARSHVTEIAKALGRRGISYRAVDMEALGERREVLDTLAITRALLHPADRTAWLAVLHAPWCGAGLADLFQLAAGDQTEHRKDMLRLYLRERASTLAPPMRTRVQRTLDVMDAALRHGGTESLSNRVERTWRSLGGDACTDKTGRQNVRQFLRVLDDMEKQGETIDLHSLERRLERLFAEAGSAPDAVDIMTIHKAKGLEWDTVLVPGMHRVGAQDRYSALDWLEMPGRAADGTRDVLLAPLPEKGDKAGTLYGFIRTTRRQRSNAELKRVFYVAATRARTSLHLFAWPEATKDGGPGERSGTLLKAAGRAALVHLVAEPIEDDEDTSPHREEKVEPLALAAVGQPEARIGTRTSPMIERLSAAYDPLEHLRKAALPHHETAEAVQQPQFARPEGTFGARAVGSSIHAFLERLAEEYRQRLQTGTSAEDAATGLLRELPTWKPSIFATLRAGGLPPDAAKRASETVSRALRNLLETEDGRWLLLPHPGAASEAAWRSEADAGTLRVRLDRSFFAGPAPHAPGDDTLWIVDFKTADRAANEQDSFLAEERTRYSGQLQTYAEMRLRVLPAGTPVMLALCYPLMSRLIHWTYQPHALGNASSEEPNQDSHLALSR